MARPGLTSRSKVSPAHPACPAMMRTAAICNDLIPLIRQQTGGFGIEHHIGQFIEMRLGNLVRMRTGEQIEIIDDGVQRFLPSGRQNITRLQPCGKGRIVIGMQLFIFGFQLIENGIHILQPAR